ncbi:unnamed protein product [Medioppia subpectinata]|uniref:Cationic amino acid transporter C-terminal domain-containing protein n=1 Tax=Medioppia subpectinata TaxID=1979941 RepID=A0A7R9KPY2_9ACAR|nr:unnamed protein product [Medioppia subpectinata]CAG2106245.1 unnamed protein product [Medioppia subpectinata]
MYSYVTVGEFIAFVIGWNMVLEYLIGTAAGSAAISACIDALYGGAIHHTMKQTFGTFVGHTPDLMAAVITILMTILLATGVKKSLMFNNVLNLVNFGVWIIIVCSSVFYIDFDNWTEHGGFAPFGWSGMLNGAATCFYAFIGFDIIATTGEEAENPQRSIPTAIITSLVIALTAYTTSGLIITLMVPYDQIDPDSAMVEMFAQNGANNLKMIVAIGALAGLLVSMLGSMFPMPRVVYAMAKDGLVFRELAQISSLTNTPLKATLILGAFTAFIAFIMSLEVLVEMMSIGTLMAYTLVSTCVLLLRYQPSRTNLVDLLPQSIRSACPTPIKEVSPQVQCSAPSVPSAPQFTPFITNKEQRIHTKRTNRCDSSESDETDPNCFRQESKDDEFLVPGNAGFHYGSVPYQHGGSSGRRSGLLDKYEKLFMYLFPYGWKVHGPASEETGLHVVKLVGVLYVLVIIFDVIMAYYINCLDWSNNRIVVLLFGAIFVAIVGCILAISRQPQIRCDLKFKAPGVPFVPAIAIIINIYLILRLSILTLVRFTVWMIAGLAMYFCYGIKNSSLEVMTNTESKDTQQMELTIPHNRVKPTSRQNEVINRPNGFTGTLSSSDNSYNWRTFE